MINKSESNACCERIVKLSYSEDVLVFTENESIFIYQIEDGKVKLTKKLQHPKMVTEFTISRDDSILVVGDELGKITHYREFLGQPVV